MGLVNTVKDWATGITASAQGAYATFDQQITNVPFAGKIYTFTLSVSSKTLGALKNAFSGTLYCVQNRDITPAVDFGKKNAKVLGGTAAIAVCLLVIRGYLLTPSRKDAE